MLTATGTAASPRLSAGQRTKPQEVTVEEHLEQLKSQVFLVILSHYKDFASSYQHRLDLRDEIGGLQDRFDSLSSKQEGLPNRPSILQDTLSLLSTLTRIHAELQGLDQLMETGELVSAAETAVEMNKCLQVLPALSMRCDCPMEIVKVIKKEVMAKTGFLKQKLAVLFASAFVFTAHGEAAELRVSPRLLAVIGQTFYDSPLRAIDVLRAMGRLGLLDNALRRLSNHVLDLFVEPILRHPHAELTVARTKLALTLTLGFAAKATADDGPSPALDRVAYVLDQLLVLCRFLKGDLFANSEQESGESECHDSFKAFIRIWGPDMVAVLVKKCLAPAVPERSDSTDAWEDLTVKIQNFEQTAKELGFLAHDQTQLHEFVARMHLRSAERLRTELLSLVRDILQSEDQNTVPVPGILEQGDIFASASEVKAPKDAAAPVGKGVDGKDGLEISGSTFTLAPCHVSTQVQTLVELAHQTLSDAATSSDDRKVDAFYCARDILDAYRAIVPEHHADALEHSPARAMLLHNDCEYVAFHLLVLAYRYSKTLPYPLADMASFLDMVPAYRKLGEAYFRNQMRKQRDALVALVASAGGFHDLGDDARCETVEKALKAALYHLSSLAKAWKPIMAAELYFAAVGLLLDVLLRAVLTNVAALGSTWTRQEAHQLAYLLALIAKSDQHFHRVSGVGRNKAIEKAPIPKYAKYWEPTREITDLIGSPTPDPAAVLMRIQAALTQAGSDADLE
ncbi:Centromere/kinetochore protein zw10 [Thoreauomyces humboldtii]|nr:Centromere/kinetochore protein zw10 [Thoreauomyces humboldtii]